MAFLIEDLRLDPESFELSRNGQLVPLEPQAFDVLIYLVRHRERVVSKEELMDAIWGGRFVTEAAVTSRIKQVRRALGDDGSTQRLLRTVHGRGYRFVGPASLDADGATPTTTTPPAAAEPATSDTPAEPGPPDHRTAPPGNHNLRGSLTQLVGRREELVLIADQLGRGRLLTILGPGGVGKTRLALEAARSRRDADGPWFVELAGLSDGTLLAETVATELGIPAVSDTAALAQLLRDRHTLVVLDNCEQIAEPVAGFVTTLLGRCPHLEVLATSRQTLGTPGEFVLDLRPLPDSEAVQLFLERASAAVPRWLPDAEEQAAVARVCRDLDDLPLAIELAAAQCRALSVHQLLDQLGDRFALLRSSRPGDRHASMTAALAWSYDTLSTDERDLFAGLSLLEASFDLDGVLAVWGRSSYLVPLLSLINKSLVTVLGGSPKRYRILETLRQFAARHRTDEHTAQAQQRIVSWVLALAEQADVELRGPHSRDWMQRLDQDKETIRAALTWSRADPVTQLRIAVGMVWFWYKRGHTREALRALDPLSATDQGDGARRSTGDRDVDSRSRAETTEGLPDSVRLRGVVGLMLLRYLAGDYLGLAQEMEQARALVDGTDDLNARSYALATIAYFEAAAGQTDQALAHAREALGIAERISSHPDAAISLLAVATAYLRADALADAEQAAADAVRHADAGGYAFGAFASSWILGKARIARGDLTRTTVEALARVVTDSARDRDLTSWLVGIVSAAYVFLRLGNTAQAAELTGIAQQQGERIGFAPEAMDPIETRHFLTQLLREIDQRQLSAAYEQGRSLETDQAIARVEELVSQVLT